MAVKGSGLLIASRVSRAVCASVVALAPAGRPTRPSDGAAYIIVASGPHFLQRIEPFAILWRQDLFGVRLADGAHQVGPVDAPAHQVHNLVQVGHLWVVHESPFVESRDL